MATQETGIASSGGLYMYLDGSVSTNNATTYKITGIKTGMVIRNVKLDPGTSGTKWATCSNASCTLSNIDGGNQSNSKSPTSWTVDSKKRWVPADTDVTATKTITKTHSAQTVTITAKYSGKYVMHTVTQPYVVKTSESSFSNATVSLSFTVPAKNSYTITYKSGGSTYKTQTKWHGEALGSVTSPSKTGYTFSKWTGSYSNGTYNTTNGSIGANDVNEAMTLNAVFTANSYALNANANNGTIPTTSGWTVASLGGSAVKNVTFDGTYGTLPTPTRSGYKFNGWYTAASGGSQVTSSTKMTTTGATIYAQWTAYKVTVSYGANGGTIADSPHKYDNSTYFKLSNGIVVSSTTSGGTYSTVTTAVATNSSYANLWNVGSFNITKTGYHIDGTAAYICDKTSLNQDYSSTSTTNPVTASSLNGGQALTSDISKTINVNWKPNTYTVTYKKNGGSGTDDQTSSHTYDSSSSLKTRSALGISRTGYDFKGWSTSSSATTATYADGASIKNLVTTNSGNINLYAVWQVHTHKLKYNLNDTTASHSGGTHKSSSTLADQTLNYGANYILPNPTRTGYTFDGWYDAASGGTKVTTSTTMGDDDVTIYAHWTEITYTLTYNINGGTSRGSVPNTATMYYWDTDNDGIAITSYFPSKTHYKFMGWSEASNGAIKYRNPVISGDGTSNKYNTRVAKTIYAIWQQSYFPPSIGTLAPVRGRMIDDTFVEGDDDESTYAQVTVPITRGTFNGYSYQDTTTSYVWPKESGNFAYRLDYRLSTNNSYSANDLITYTYSSSEPSVKTVTYNNIIPKSGGAITDLNILNTYEVRVRITPTTIYNGTTITSPDFPEITKTDFLSPVFYVLDIGRNGNTIAIGGVAHDYLSEPERRELRIYIPTIFQNNADITINGAITLSNTATISGATTIGGATTINTAATIDIPNTTTARTWLHKFTAGLTEGDADVTDNTVFMCGNINEATNDWYYRKCIRLFNYIANKLGNGSLTNLISTPSYIRANSGFYCDNGNYYHVKDKNGVDRILCGANTSSDGTTTNYFFGYGSRAAAEGTCYFDGHSISIRSDSAISMTGNATISGTLRVNNILTLYREGTTANNYYAGIAFSVKDTTTGVTDNNGYIRVYEDHADTSYGTNMVLQSGGGMFIGGGESPGAHYAAKIGSANYTSENTFITSDDAIFIQANGGTIANRLGFYINNSHQVIPCKADAATNNVGSLGTSSYKWADVYTTNLNGTAVPAITAGTAGTSSATSGSTLAVPYVTYNNRGMITGTGTHTHSISGIFKVTTVSASVAALSANSYLSATDITITAQSGYTAAGIVGWSSNHWRICPTSYYIKNNTTLFAGFCNRTATATTSATTIYFYILWIKGSSG